MREFNSARVDQPMRVGFALGTGLDVADTWFHAQFDTVHGRLSPHGNERERCTWVKHLDGINTVIKTQL